MHVTFLGNRDFAGVIKLGILRWGDYYGLSAWPQCDHKGSFKKEAGGSELGREGRVMTEAEGEKMT